MSFKPLFCSECLKTLDAIIDFKSKTILGNALEPTITILCHECFSKKKEYIQVKQ